MPLTSWTFFCPVLWKEKVYKSQSKEFTNWVHMLYLFLQNWSLRSFPCGTCNQVLFDSNNTRQSEGQLYPPPLQNSEIILHTFHEKSSRGIRDKEWTRNRRIPTFDLQVWPWPWAAMGSAHQLDEVNIWPEFHENPSRCIGDIEWTWNGRVQMFDLQVWPWPWARGVGTWVLHNGPLRLTFDPSYMKILQGVKEI